jgi:hypothetical protein
MHKPEMPKKLIRHIELSVHSKRNGHLPAVLSNSMPKAGSNLVRRFLQLIPDMKNSGHFDLGPDQAITKFTDVERRASEKFLGQITAGIYGTSHCFYFDELAEILDRRRIKCLTIMRDPRDVCVSDYHYIMSNPQHRLHSLYKEMPNDHERLMSSIVGLPSESLGGDAPSLDIGEHYRHFKGWLSYSNGLVFKFKDLIGAKGGGSEDVQDQTIRRILAYLGIDMGEVGIEHIKGELFSKQAHTFRRGQIGDWRDEFSREHEAAFEKVAGDILDLYTFQR